MMLKMVLSSFACCLLILFSSSGSAYPTLKLSRFNGRLFDYSVLCDARRHRIDIFIDFLQTKGNYYLFRDMNQTGLALSSNFRSSLASWATTLETMLVGDLGPRGFYYNDGQLYPDKTARAVPRTTGTTTEGGMFHLFSVSNFLNGQPLASNMLSISMRRLESREDPHFATTIPITNPNTFYDYTNPSSSISEIIDKVRLVFERFDFGLFGVLNNAGFKRV